VAASHRSTQALIEAGHKRIGVVAELEWWHGGGLDEFIAGVVAGAVAPGHLFPSWQRLYGYMQAHIVAGLPIDRCLVARVGSYSVEAAETAIRGVLQDVAAAPTAFFSADGLMSAAIMGVVKELGLSIPGDLSLVCFDDLDWMRFYQPAVTAVLQPTRKMGETAARLVLDRIHGEPSPARREVLETTLIRRASIQPPASAG
jgi:LacI family transcriptional regulator